MFSAGQIAWHSCSHGCIIGFDMALMQAMGAEMQFMQQMAHEGRIAQGLFIARKP